MKRIRNKHPFVSQMLQDLAEKAGVEILVEPEYGYAGQIRCPNGKIHYFRKTHFDLNPLGATEIAKDKDYASFFMRRLGYPVIPSQKFYSPEHCEAIGSRRGQDAAARYAARRFPVIVKPNSRSLGMAVSAVYDPEEFSEAASRAFEKDRVILVQKLISGKDYRVVVLDGEVLSAYQRLPLSVIGNGTSSVAFLLEEKRRDFERIGRDTLLNTEDPRMLARLAHLGMDLETVVPSGERVVLLDSANLSSGGDAVDVTDSIHPGYRRIAVELTRDMGLRYSGIDLMVQGDIARKPGRYWVIEINASPGIDNYASGGDRHRAIVERLYLKVLEAIRDL